MINRAFKVENPRRLVDLIRRVRKEIFKKTQEEMAEVLNVAGKTSSGEPVCEYTRTIINNIENGYTPIRYTHIEAYARALRLPAGVLLLISRFQRAELAPEALETVNALQKVISKAATNGEGLGIEHLTKLSGLTVASEAIGEPKLLSQMDILSAQQRFRDSLVREGEDKDRLI